MANNSESVQVFKNTGWLFFDRIIRQGLNFLITVYIARYLGAEEFGYWNYAIAFVALLSFFSTFGLYNVLLRDFVRFPEQAGKLVGSALSIRFLGGCLTSVFSLALIMILKPGESSLHILIFIVSLNFVAQSADVIDYYFQSHLKSEVIAWSRGISFIVFGVVKLLLIQFQYPLIYFAIAQAAEFLLSGLLLLMFLGKSLPLSDVKIDFSLAKTLVRSALPILFSEIAIIVYMRTDQVMIGEMIGDRALGNYSAAVKLSEIWYFIPGIICSSFFPSIVRAHSENNKLYQQKLQELYDLLSGISMGIAVVVSLTAHWIIAILFGPDYSNAASVLVIHIWTGVFVFWGFASNQQLVVEHLTHISLYRTVSGMIVNLALNFVLIPRMGIAGAAVATLIAQAVSSWFSNIFFKESRPIFWTNVRSLNLLRFLTLSRSMLKKGSS